MVLQEHLLERLAVPGFLTARRYEVVGGARNIFPLPDDLGGSLKESGLPPTDS